jgi:2-succinyl-6-hydroxy-2,4-cyclohexadiene-1-carboxylate synthase
MTTSPLCALHGFSRSPQSFETLALPHLWAPFLCGHGPTPDLHSQDFGAEIARVAALLRQNFQAPVSLLGYSMGARVALGLGLRHPDLFSRVTLIGVNPGLEDNQARTERLAWEAGWEELLLNEGLEAFDEQWRKQPLFASQNSLPQNVQEEQRRERWLHTPTGLAFALRVLGLGAMPNFWPELPNLKTPVLWVVGGKDEKFLRLAKRAASLSDFIQLEVVQGSGHNPLLEAPQQVRSLLLSERPPT